MILLDTSILVSYFNSRDDNHARALELFNKISELKYGEAIVSDYIFDEFATVLLLILKDFSKVVDVCSEIKNLIKFKISDEYFDESWSVFSSQNKTSFSFTDCSSIALLKKNAGYFATFDEEFKGVKEINVVGLE